MARRSPTSDASKTLLDFHSPIANMSRLTSKSMQKQHLSLGFWRMLPFPRKGECIMEESWSCQVQLLIFGKVKFAAVASEASLFSLSTKFAGNRKPLSWSHLWWIISCHRTSVCRCKGSCYVHSSTTGNEPPSVLKIPFTDPIYPLVI